MSLFPPFSPGDAVEVLNWRHAGSRDARVVVECWPEKCQGGWMILIDRPLQNGSAEISAAWAVLEYRWQHDER